MLKLKNSVVMDVNHSGEMRITDGNYAFCFDRHELFEIYLHLKEVYADEPQSIPVPLGRHKPAPELEGLRAEMGAYAEQRRFEMDDLRGTVKYQGAAIVALQASIQHLQNVCLDFEAMMKRK